jgi:membrane protease YdiL (CAAX protease family)
MAQEKHLVEVQESMEEKPTRWWDLVLYLLAGMGLFYGVGILVAMQFDEIDFTVLAIALASNIFTLGGVTYVLGILRKRISWRGMGLFPPVWRWEYLFLAAVLAIGMMPIRGIIGALVEYMIHGGLESLEMRNDLFTSAGMTWGGFVVMLLGVGVLAPVAEELYFRGLIYGGLRKMMGVGWSVFISSAIFGVGHADSIAVVVSSLIMGLVMAYAYEKTRTLWVPVLIHVITNSTAVVLMYSVMLLSDLLDISL